MVTEDGKTLNMDGDSNDKAAADKYLVEMQ